MQYCNTHYRNTPKFTEQGNTIFTYIINVLSALKTNYIRHIFLSFHSLLHVDMNWYMKDVRAQEFHDILNFTKVASLNMYVPVNVITYN